MTLTILIDELLEPEEEALAFKAGEGTDITHEVPKGIATLLAEAHEAIEAEGDEERHGDADVELNVDGAAGLVDGIP